MDMQDVLSALEQEAERDGVPILRGPERDLLLDAAAMANPRRILEIGTAIGFSALLMASRCQEAEIDTIEIDKDRYHRAVAAIQAAGCEGRIRCHLGDAAEIIQTLKGPYDFLYLDGPKGQYLRQLQAIEPMLSSGAVIAADNVLFRGLVNSKDPIPHRYRTLVTRLRAYIAYVKERYDTRIYEEGDGLAVSQMRESANRS